MKLVLHRSFTFWSGILVMAFVCWAWRDSYRHSAFYQFGRAALVNQSGGVALEFWNASIWQGSRDQKQPGDPQLAEPLFPAPFFVLQGEISPEEIGTRWESVYDEVPLSPIPYREILRLSVAFEPGAWAYFLPHWLTLLTVAAIWLTLLIWRARRRRSIWAQLGLTLGDA